MKILEMNKHNKNIYSIDYDITRACNNRCSYCCVMDNLDNSQLFNREVFESVITAVNNFKQEGTLAVSLLGGDPLMIPNQVKEFYQRIKCDLTVFSNLNYYPFSENIQLIKDLDIKIINSWHDSSNQNWVKINILQLKQKVKPILMINTENIDLMYKNYKWLIANKIQYSIQFIRNKVDEVCMNINDSRITEMFSTALFSSYNIIDDKTYDDIQTLEHDLLNIAMKYKVICRLNILRILYNGKIRSPCNNSIDMGYIHEGLNIKEILCSGNNCLCDTSNYKRILCNDC